MHNIFYKDEKLEKKIQRLKVKVVKEQTTLKKKGQGLI